MSEAEIIPEVPEVDPVENTEVAEATEEVEAVEGQEEAASSEDADQPKRERKSRAQERINALTREKYERDKMIEQLQYEMQQIKQVPQPVKDEIPSLADFDYDENRYRQAMQEWGAQQATKAQEAIQNQLRERQQQQEALRQQQIVQQKIQTGMEKYPDFSEKVNAVPSLQQVNPYAYQTMIESDIAHDIAYYLANNQQDYYRLSSLTPVQAIREITLLEAKLKAAPPQKVSVPPKPPSRISDGTSEAVKDPSKMTTEEWMAWRNNQLSSKR